MTRLSRYSEAFWGPDFTSTAGFEALSQRMKDGRTLCKDFEEYLKQRYEMEKQYFKDLQKLQKNMKHREEIGVLERSWNKMRDEVEKMVQIHHDAANHFQRQMDEVKKFSEGQANKRKSTEETVKRYQTNKNNLYNNCMKSHKSYKDKCRDKDTAHDTYTSMKSSVTTLAKDLDKAAKSKAKTEDDANKAEVAYKSSIDSLESARINWEKEMHEACETFQKLDEDRIYFLRECLWVSVNVDSQSAVDIDDCCEKVRLMLENCKVEEDISSFIQRHQTGIEKPAAINFENYYTNVDVPRGQVQRSGAQRAQPQRTQPYNGVNMLDDTYAVVDVIMVIFPTPEHGQNVIVQLFIETEVRPKLTQAFTITSECDDAGVYASLQGAPAASRHSAPVTGSDSAILVITRPYKAQIVTELTVEIGQRVHFVRRMDGNCIQVRLEGTNKFGIIPHHCVQQYM